MPMKLEEWLKNTTRLLADSSIPTARLDCLVLLEDSIGKDRAWLLAHPEFELSLTQAKKLDSLVKRRANHEPLAYIRGKSEFYGREFMVNSHTLEPRPETETMIDLLKSFNCSGPIVDVGTGSGCLAITAKLQFPDATVYGTDIDAKCVETAQQNAKRHSVKVQFFVCDLLEAVLLTPYHLPAIVIANLPYVPDSHTINPAAMFEPRHAIFGGVDGLDYYRRLFVQIDKQASRPTYIFTESLPFQHKSLGEIAGQHGFRQVKAQDLIQVFKLTGS